MKAVERRAVDIGARARGRRAERLADELRALLPEAEVEERGSSIRLTGVGLRKRWLNEPALRFITRTIP